MKKITGSSSALLYSSIMKAIPENSKDRVIMLFILIILLLIIVLVVLNSLKLTIYQQINHVKKIIYFGETCDLENNMVSKDYALGYQLAFSWMNRNGGVNGYIIKLILLNDRYEADEATKNGKLLVDYYDVLGIVGTFGTNTTMAILKNVIGDRLIPLIGPFTGSPAIRSIFNEFIVTTSPSVYPELDLMVESLVQNSYQNIAILYQNDPYGLYSYNALVDYILKKGVNINIVSVGTYQRNSDDLDASIGGLFDKKYPYNYTDYDPKKLKKIQAIVVYTIDKKIDIILSRLKKINPDVAIYYNAYIGTRSSNVASLKHESKTNIYQTLIELPDLEDYPELNTMLDSEIVEYNKDKSHINHIMEKSSCIIHGFYSGLMICKVLQNFKNMKELNRKTFMEMFYKMKTIDVYGFKMGPLVVGKNNEAVKYAILRKLQDDLTFRTVKELQIDDFRRK